MTSEAPPRHRARKRFGQHFLHDARIVQRMVTAIAPQPGQRLVEIGPGLGALTGPLLERCHSIDVVELDRDVIPILQERCGSLGELRIHAMDALLFDLHTVTSEPQRVRIVGNLPYNISTPLMFHLLGDIELIDDMHFMVQKEVAERICAAPGSGEYGRLSVMVQYRCTADNLFHVGPGAFSPPPKVDSAVIRLRPLRPTPWPPHDSALLSKIVAGAFAQRRKTLRNSLKSIATADQIRAAGIDPGVRAEELAVAEFVALSSVIASAAET